VSVIPSKAEIQAARIFLSGYFAQTRLVKAPALSEATGRRVHLKLEMELPTASFKVRGAMWALSEKLKQGPVAEVVASSTGNHGAAVAYAAQNMDVKATIFLPKNCNPVKRERIARLGAGIVEKGGADQADAFLAASEHSRNTGAYFLNDATDPVLPAGPATIGSEILEQLPETQRVYVPMGDTALIRGVAAALKQTKPSVKLVGVQAKTAPSYYLSWKSGVATETETCNTIADGLATRTPEAVNVRAIRELVDEVVLVSEEEMLRAIECLLMKEHIVAEPAAAAATAALLQRKSSDGEITVALVTGANVQREILQRSLQLNSF
jgi:threonine dehydratase